jgi:hypothetical protein
MNTMATINTRLQSQTLATDGSIGGAIMIYALMRKREMFTLDGTERL